MQFSYQCYLSFKQASDLLQKYNEMDGNAELFANWMKSTCFATKRNTHLCINEMEKLSAINKKNIIIKQLSIMPINLKPGAYMMPMLRPQSTTNCNDFNKKYLHSNSIVVKKCNVKQLKHGLLTAQNNNNQKMNRQSERISIKDLTDLKKSMKNTVTVTNTKLKDLQSEMNHIQELSTEFYSKLTYVHQKTRNDKKISELRKKLNALEKSVNEMNRNLRKLNERDLEIVRSLEQFGNQLHDCNEAGHNYGQAMVRWFESNQEKMVHVEENICAVIKKRFIDDRSDALGANYDAKIQQEFLNENLKHIFDEHFKSFLLKFEKRQMTNLKYQFWFTVCLNITFFVLYFK